MVEACAAFYRLARALAPVPTKPTGSNPMLPFPPSYCRWTILPLPPLPPSRSTHVSPSPSVVLLHACPPQRRPRADLRHSQLSPLLCLSVHLVRLSPCISPMPSRRRLFTRLSLEPLNLPRLASYHHTTFSSLEASFYRHKIAPVRMSTTPCRRSPWPTSPPSIQPSLSISPTRR